MPATKPQRMPTTGTKQTSQHARDQLRGGKKSITERSKDTFLSNEPTNGNVELDNSRGDLTNERDENRTAESDALRAAKDRIETVAMTAKRTQLESKKKYFDRLPGDVKHRLQFCEARVVLQRLEHQQSSYFLLQKTTKIQNMSSSVTSFVPQRQETLDNVRTAKDNAHSEDTNTVSNDFLVEAKQLGYKTRLRWNTIIQTCPQTETNVHDCKDTGSDKSDHISHQRNHKRKDVLLRKESEPKTCTNGTQKVDITPSSDQPSNDRKRKQATPLQCPSLKSKRRKGLPLIESGRKTPTAKGKRRDGRTFCSGQSFNNGKSKQSSPVQETVKPKVKKVLPLKELEPKSKTSVKGKRNVGPTSCSGKLSSDGKSKQVNPIQKHVSCKGKKVLLLKASAKEKQRAAKTSSKWQPSSDGKRKQASSVRRTVKSKGNDALPEKEPEPKTSAGPKTSAKGKQKVGKTSTDRQPSYISNNGQSEQSSPLHVMYRKERIWPPEESKKSTKGKQEVGTTSCSRQPSNDGKREQPPLKSEETPVRQVRRRNRKKHVYVCEGCGYRTRCRSTMEVHVRIHTGEKPFGCCLCSYRTTCEKYLRTHMQKHTGLESPYVCEHCGYTTGSKPALIGHIRIHTGEKPYICDVCGYRTRTSSRMNGHVRIHTNKRSYRCGQCTYRANRRDSLVRHYLTHTGDKPYHCTHCDYKSTQNSTLKRHVFLVHEKPKRVQEKEKGEP
ncbi:uncharacterized protein LOC144866176 isoform X1 [Branchiostoma floridae x Branchiostoma japonicum]